MTPRPVRRLAVAALGLVIGGIVASLGCSAPPAAHPTDAQLRQRFAERRETFEKLLAMAREENGVGAISYGFRDDRIQMKEDRWNEYRALFGELGLEHGLLIQPGGIVFLASTAADASGGSAKGYYWSPTPPTPLVASLDSIPEGSRSNVPSYAALDGSWVLFFQWGS